MPARIDAAVARVIGVRDEVLAALEPLTDEQWHLMTAAEQWPVGYAARHIANGFRQAEPT